MKMRKSMEKKLEVNMQHVPNVDTIIIETERIATEPIYEDVRRRV